MPPLTVATALLALDRYAGMHFFTNGHGGNMMNYANLFWLFGHPEVYILIIPAFGVYSEVISTFSSKRLYGYTSLVYAVMAIAVLSFTVWLHHFFTMGQGADVNAAFGVATMLIGIPTGVKIFDWLLTMYRGQIRLTVPMLYALGFIVLFAVGGTTGIILASPGVDYQVHNTVFLVAHFHNVLIPGLLFGMLGATHYWFPKAFGFRLDERWGRISFFGWLFGFLFAFMPLYALGLLGLPRRTVEYFEPAYRPWTMAALFGAFLILCALAAWAIMLVVSIRNRHLERGAGGRSLGWPDTGMDELGARARVELREDPGRDWTRPVLAMKGEGRAYRPPAVYEDIALPSNSAVGPVVGIALGFASFAIVWHIWWLTIAGFACAWIAVIARSFVTDTERVVTALEIREHEERWLRLARDAAPTTRFRETAAVNTGLAERHAA